MVGRPTARGSSALGGYMFSFPSLAFWRNSLHSTQPCRPQGHSYVPSAGIPTVVTCIHLTTLPLCHARGAGATPPTSLICAGAGAFPWQAGAPPSPLPMTTLGHTGHFSWPFYSCSRSSPASGFDYCSHAPRGNPTGPNSLLVLPPNTLSHGQPGSFEHARAHDP